MSFLHQRWGEAHFLVLQLSIEGGTGLSLGQFQLHNQSGDCPSHLQPYGRGYSWSQEPCQPAGRWSQERHSASGWLSPQHRAVGSSFFRTLLKASAWAARLQPLNLCSVCGPGTLQTRPCPQLNTVFHLVLLLEVTAALIAFSKASLHTLWWCPKPYFLHFFPF